MVFDVLIEIFNILMENSLGWGICLVLGYIANIVKDFVAWKRYYKWFWKDIVADEYDVIIGSIQPKVGTCSISHGFLILHK